MTGVMVPAPAAALALLQDKALARLLDILCEGEGQARIVGGALRNALLGRFVHEIDVATTLLPETVAERAAAAGLRNIPTGIAHGTVTVLVDGKSFEVTTLREDIETDGRHAVVRFGADFALDALRRDFTVNALSMDRQGQLYDYTGGIEDLAAKRIRFIGDARTRIREDYLRILRFFRFSADYAEGALDAGGLSASINERGGLAHLSKERVRAELLKLLMARRAGAVTQDMSEAGLLDPLLTLAPNPGRLQRLIAFQPGADVMLRLAALCIYLPEDADRLRDNLRLSNEEHRRLGEAARALLTLHGRDVPPPAGDLRILLFEHGRQVALDALFLAQADARYRGGEVWAAAEAFLRDTPEPRLPFSGADLQARGFIEGRALGAALKDLQARWIKAGFPQDPHSLALLLDEVAKQK
ncbi:CCA tRNA nucleotidyltransferase [Methyloferula stellata]|uniref:CCA tRNA nucleotidyltransferase n=1 Tax=Methyloferula stellata TaxID=876270 RepID=UPI00037389BE|nr:CCA tRNA nucleotidyltransferase [Methyloferula stellata]